MLFSGNCKLFRMNDAAQNSSMSSKEVKISMNKNDIESLIVFFDYIIYYYYI